MFKDPTNANNLKVHISFCCPVANKGLSGKKKVNSVFTEDLNQLLINQINHLTSINRSKTLCPKEKIF